MRHSSKPQPQGATLSGTQLQGASIDGAFIWRVKIENIDLTNAKVSYLASEPVFFCADAINNFHCPWTSDEFLKLRNQITASVPEDLRWAFALSLIDPKLDPTKPFQGKEFTDKSPALIAPSRRQPSTSVYESEVAQQWQEAGCAAEGAPYVASA